MKIGVDFSRAFLKERTGTEEYAYQLFKQFISINPGDNEFIFYVKSDSDAQEFLPDFCFLKKIKGRKFWTQLHLSWEMFKNPVDILFIPSHTIPFFHPKKSVVTIHGLEFKYFPQSCGWKERIMLEFGTFISAKLSSKIIVPSWNTKRDLIKFYKINPKKIFIVSHGFRRIVEKRKNEHRGFNLLFVGRLEKRKNIVGIIRSFNFFMDSVGDRECRLILAGRNGYGFGEIEEEILKSNYKENIILTGYVSEDQKNLLWKEADVFVFPSFYEGFGLPVLESMAYGVPVICSKGSALEEISFGSALLVDPYNYLEIADATLKIFKDKALRSEMIERGYENIKKFSWEKCASQTLDIIKG